MYERVSVETATYLTAFANSNGGHEADVLNNTAARRITLAITSTGFTFSTTIANVTAWSTQKIKYIAFK